MQWRKIETAPKDGTSILLRIDDCAIEGNWHFPMYGKPHWSPISLSSHGCGCCASDDSAPTHWCPLPEE